MKCTSCAVAAVLAVVWVTLVSGFGAPPESALTPPANGPKHADPALHALVDATVHPGPGAVIEHATVVIRDGRIESVGAGTAAPAGARVWDCRGLHVYAGFVDPYVEVDAPKPSGNTASLHWNARVTPQRTALDGSGVDAGTAEGLRKLGFVAAALSPKGGVFRGSAAVVSLAKPEDDATQARPGVYRAWAYQSVGLETGGDYPDSQMGAIALVRQTLSDAQWQFTERQAGKMTTGANAIDALAPRAQRAGERLATTILFTAEDELEVLRGAKIAAEFGRPLIMLGSGYEFRRLGPVVDALSALKAPLILPVNFPKAPKAGSIGEAESLDLRELMTWEQAPTNPRRVDAVFGAKDQIAFTTAKLKDRAAFAENVRKAIRAGLAEDRALAMLTTNPAGILGLNTQLGTVETGKIASLVVTDGPIFKKKTKIRDVWVDGKRHEITPPPPALFEGTFAVRLDPAPPSAPEIQIVISKENPPAVTIKKKDNHDKWIKVNARSVRVIDTRISWVFDHDDFGQPGVFTMSGVIDPTPAPAPGTVKLGADGKPSEGPALITGDGTRTDGQRFRWTATRTTPEPEEKKADEKKPDDKKGEEKKDDAKKDDDKGAPPEKDEKPEVKKESADDGVSGAWNCTTSGPAGGRGLDFVLALKLEGTKVSGTSKSSIGEQEISSGSWDAGSRALTLTIAGPGGNSVQANLKIDGNEMRGTAAAGPATFTVTGTRGGAPGKDSGADEDEEVPVVPEHLVRPFGAFGFDELPDVPDAMAIRNATIWTSGPAGMIDPAKDNQGSLLLVKRGVIEYAGPAKGGPAIPEGAVDIDGTGKHVTAGLIDCHSHTGISKGVNESGQAVTAEVRIQDVTNPDAMNWYRQLAGGLTTVNNLHGSANPMGGQNCVNKIRWGAAAPDDMHLEGAIAGIKFALGENVKRAGEAGGGRAGGGGGERYPGTRMGVETLMRDRFTAAREYSAAWERYKRSSHIFIPPPAEAGPEAKGTAGDTPPRRDLELEALAEILDGKRLVHCHSYRQDEILMLCRIARDFGFRIGTFQHVLEGYKVADEIKAASGGGSAFSDWWAYKVEVQDAIPYCGAIMHDQGVTVSFNSDSDEMARRMNVEAAKAMRYGNLSAEEALKFVTINPARQLKIDAKVGSLEKGKDADIALWSGPPLSTLSRCERTWVDGRPLFSLEYDRMLRKRDGETRQRIIQKLIAGEAKKKGKKGEAKDVKKDEEKPKGEGTPPPKAPGDAWWATSGAGEPDEAVVISGRRLMLLEAVRRAQDLRREYFLELYRRGVNPDDARIGECGCLRP